MDLMKRPVLRLVFPALLLALALGVLFTAKALAQQPTPSDDDVNRVAKQMYCPVCENIPLDVCPTQACAQWRELIREKLAAGWTDQQIKDYFVMQYGDRVLAEPPRRGLNWLAYVLPPVGLLIGGVILFFVFRSMRSPQAQPGSPASAQDAEPGKNGREKDEYLSRLEEELRRRQE